MPVYEYKCGKCRRTFDVKAGIKDAGGRVECPVCGSSKTARVFSVFSPDGVGERLCPVAAALRLRLVCSRPSASYRSHPDRHFRWVDTAHWVCY